MSDAGSDDDGPDDTDGGTTEWGVRSGSGEILLSGISRREPAEAAARKVRGVAIYRTISRWREAPAYLRERVVNRRR